MSGLHHDAPTRVDHGALDLQRSRDFQAALLGMAGHDLRQPLQIIQSAYEWLGSRVAQGCEKARLERGERAIAKLTEQLDRLVGALRLYEHTQSMEIADIALAPLFWRIANENEKDALERGIDMRVHTTRGIVMSNPDPAIARPSDGTQDGSSLDPSQARQAAGPRRCPFPDGGQRPSLAL